MIRVTVELVPHGDESRARLLARGTITNDGTGTLQRGNYRFRFWNGKATKKGPWREGEVRDFPRRDKNVWWLLGLCLDSVRNR